MEILRIEDLAKTFVLHHQHGARIPVLGNVGLSVEEGESVALTGPSGAGKSTLMRMIFGNYATHQGRILVRHDGQMVDLAAAAPREVLDIRRRTIGYISQFLRVAPRVPCLEIVAGPLRERGVGKAEAEARAADMLARLNIPQNLWPLSPVTFSGGEQQRVNIAHGFAADYPLYLLDEPTASLDPINRAVVLSLIREALERGSAVIGIFHDKDARDEICTREFEIEPMRQAS